jgi:DNA invertase Pin-like site-specific DNA recombinase
MIIGYARTSTEDQKAGYAAQARDLHAAGADAIYQEQVSSVQDRPELRRAIAALLPNDTLVVTKLDRLARSMRNLTEIIDLLEQRGAALRILDFGGASVDTRSATGRLMLNLFGGFAQFEREMMLERQREGIARARSQGKYKGRKPWVHRRREEVETLAQTGASQMVIAARTGMSRASVRKLLGEMRL